MATEGGDKVGLKTKMKGPTRQLLCSKSRANRRQAPGGGGGEGGVSGTQEEVREEVDLCSGVDFQTTRGNCSPDKEKEEGRATRKSQKGAWRRVLSSACTCFRRRRRRRPHLESSTPGCAGEQLGPSGRGAKRKKRFPGLTWPPPLFQHLLTSSREQAGRAGPRSAGEDASETRQPLNVSLNADERLRDAQEPTGRSSEVDKPESVALENDNNGSVVCLSEAVLDETEDGGRHVPEHRSDRDVVIMEMSVQEPEAVTESQLGCSSWDSVGFHSPEEESHGPMDRSRDPAEMDRSRDPAEMDRSRDPAESHLTRPSAAHSDLVNIAMATAIELPDDEASPAGGSSEEEKAIAFGLSNGLHRDGAGVAMVTNDHLAARCRSSADVVVVPLIRLNSGEEDVACDWEAAAVDVASLEDGVGVEVDWEVKGGGGDADREAELVRSAHAVVQAAMFAAVQQLLREQQNSVDHVDYAHHHDIPCPPTLKLPTH